MDDDTNVISLRPREGGPPPGLPPLPSGPPAPPPPAAPPAAPPPDLPDGGAAPFPARTRRSAADSLVAVPLESPALPATFRSDGVPARADGEHEDQAPGLGALSMSAILAVALAALRGTAGVVKDWRQRRMERAEEAAPLRQARLKQRLAEQEALAKHGLTMQGIDQQGAQQRAKHRTAVPSGQDYGRKTLGSKAGGPAGAKGGKGPDPAAGAKAKRDSDRRAAVDKADAAKQQAKQADQAAARQQAAKDADAKRTAQDDARKRAEKDADAKRAAKTADAKARGKGADAVDHKPSGKDSDPAAAAKAKREADRQAAADKTRAAKDQDRIAAKADARKQAAKDADARRSAAGQQTRGKGTDGTTDGPRAVKAGADKSEGAKGETAADKAARRLRERREAPDKPFLSRDRKTGTDSASKPADGTTEAPRAPGPGEGSGGREKPADGPRTGPKRGPSGGPNGGPGGSWWTPPPRGERRGVHESARDATAGHGPTITVERTDSPGDAERRRPAPAAVTTGVAGLPRAPHRPAGPRPGTTAPTKEAPMSAQSVRLPGMTPGVAAEHMTEVTLDDVLDHLADATGECLTTYDECASLAGQARKLRQALTELSQELRGRHNVVGHLTMRAMEALAESMDLLAKQAEEMRSESLTAAEAVESVHDDMADAYKPVQRAAADAGLHMPSARIHNED